MCFVIGATLKGLVGTASGTTAGREATGVCLGDRARARLQKVSYIRRSAILVFCALYLRLRFSPLVVGTALCMDAVALLCEISCRLDTYISGVQVL